MVIDVVSHLLILLVELQPCFTRLALVYEFTCPLLCVDRDTG